MPKKLGLFVAAVMLGACVYVGAKIIEVPTATGGVMLLGGGTPSGVTTTTPATVYFGMCTTAGVLTGDNGDDNTGNSVGWNCNYDASKTWTCPSTGTKTIVELASYVKDGPTAGTASVRTALYYNNEGTFELVCQGNAAKATGAGYAWISHTSGASELSGTCTCTGGTNYLIATARTGDITQRSTTSCSTCLGYEDAGTYATDGFPASESYSGFGTADIILAVRVGVQ